MANVDGYAMFYQAGRTCPVNCPMRCSDTNYVTKITHWQGGSCTRAVEMEWSDGTVQTAGTKDGDVSTATFSEPFLIYRVSLFPVLRRIYISFNLTSIYINNRLGYLQVTIVTVDSMV